MPTQVQLHAVHEVLRPADLEGQAPATGLQQVHPPAPDTGMHDIHSNVLVLSVRGIGVSTL